MDLRAKLAIVFLGILVPPFLAVSVVQVDHSMGTMVEDLGDSGTLLADQAFEQIRSALASATNASGGDLADGAGQGPGARGLPVIVPGLRQGRSLRPRR